MMPTSPSRRRNVRPGINRRRNRGHHRTNVRRRNGTRASLTTGALALIADALHCHCHPVRPTR